MENEPSSATGTVVPSAGAGLERGLPDAAGRGDGFGAGSAAPTAPMYVANTVTVFALVVVPCTGIAPLP